MGKTDIATGRTMVIDVPPAPSAPDYLDVTKDGKFVFSGNYYHSTTMVFSTDPFKLIKEIPVGKNPHGHDITADNKYVLVSDKLSSTMTIIDIAKQAVKRSFQQELVRSILLWMPTGQTANPMCRNLGCMLLLIS